MLPGYGTGKSQQTALRGILDLQNHPTNQVELKRTTICVGENTNIYLSRCTQFVWLPSPRRTDRKQAPFPLDIYIQIIRL